MIPTRNSLTPALLICLCLLGPAPGARADAWIDVVYLKNGGVVRGVIAPQPSTASLRIETRDGNVLIFKMDEVDRFGKERVSPRVEPAKVEPAKVEPAKVEPAKVEPAKVEPAKVEPAKVEPAPWTGRRMGLGGSLTSGLSYLQFLSLAGGGSKTNTVRDVVLAPLDLTAGLVISSGERGPEHLIGLTFRQVFVASGGTPTSSLDIFARYRFRQGLFTAGGGIGLDTGSGGITFALTGHAGLELGFTRNIGLAFDLLSFTTYLRDAKSIIFNLMLGPTARFFF